MPNRLDLVFLDGEHSYAAVSHEIMQLGPRIVDSGVLAFHDAVAFEGVAKAIGEALASGLWQFGGNVDNLVWLKNISYWVKPAYSQPGTASARRRDVLLSAAAK